MRRLAICTALALALTPAGAAVAKEPVKATVCGPSDCATVKDRDTLMTIIEGAGPTDPPKSAGAWYAVQMTIEVDRGRHDTFPMAVVPSEGLLRAGDPEAGYTWMTMSPGVRSDYARITRGVAPNPAATLEGVQPVRADAPAEPTPDGGSSPLPWIVGGALLALGLVALVIRRRGLPWPRPAQG